jgi:hypothetical protein
MSWKRLIPTTFAASALAVGAAILAFPTPSAGQGECGGFNGKMCEDICTKECSSGTSSCSHKYTYWPEV